MKLLFDQNLSPALVRRLADVYPDSAHVLDAGLDKADDQGIWRFARQYGFAIVSKDGDFRQLSFLIGAPPKVIWVRLGNCTTRGIEAALRSRRDELHEFDSADEAAFLILV